MSWRHFVLLCIISTSSLKTITILGINTDATENGGLKLLLYSFFCSSVGASAATYGSYKFLKNYYEAYNRAIKIVEIKNKSHYDVQLTIPYCNHIFYSNPYIKKPKKTPFYNLIVKAQEKWKSSNTPLLPYGFLFLKTPFIALHEFLIHEYNSDCHISISTHKGWFKPFCDKEKGTISIMAPTLPPQHDQKIGSFEIIKGLNLNYTHQLKIIINEEGLIEAKMQ